jgi:hypothetical protein
MIPFSLGQSWAIDNVVVPLASGYGLAEEYKYLKSSISQYLTGMCVYFFSKNTSMKEHGIVCHSVGRATLHMEISRYSHSWTDGGTNTTCHHFFLPFSRRTTAVISHKICTLLFWTMEVYHLVSEPIPPQNYIYLYFSLFSF